LGTQFTVVDRHQGTLLGRYPFRPFFAFHHANAFEKEGNLYLDIVCYDDASVITGIKDHFRPDAYDSNYPTRLDRFTLDLKNQILICDTLSAKPMEFPRVNEAFDGKPYRYVYATDPRSPISDADIRPLYKIDTETKEVLQWEEAGCYPGEPVFAASPDAKEEDEGVVLAVVLDPANHSSFLLILDAKTFQEIGRAQAPHPIPEGLHGQYFSQPSV
jgi:carotenoid cleavage dioxygenase-like enzyme